MRGLLMMMCATLLSALCISAAPAAANDPANREILVLPFSTPSGASDAWIGKAIQQDLSTDLTEGTIVRVVAPAGAAPAADAAEAIDSARRAGASFVIYGQAQSNQTPNETQVRFTGQVLDVATAKPVGALKATGPRSQLFHLEDAISGQTLAMLPREMLSPRAASAVAAGPQAAAQNQAAQPQTAPQTGVTDLGSVNAGAYAPPTGVSPGAYSYVPPPDSYPAYVQSAPLYTYSYDYGAPLPAYTYGYPAYDLYPFAGFGFGFGFFGDDFFGFDHFHDHDGGHGHGDFNHGGFNHGGIGGHGNGAFGNRPGFAGGRPGFGGGFHGGAFAPGFHGGGFRGAGGFGGFHGGGGGFHGGGGSGHR